MRVVALLILGACGGQPALANAPRPNPAAVAGVAAAAAAALTLADPSLAGHKPEKDRVVDENGVEVTDTVPSDVLDRLDHRKGSAASADDPAKPTAAPKSKGPSPKLPSPKDAIGGP